MFVVYVVIVALVALGLGYWQGYAERGLEQFNRGYAKGMIDAGRDYEAGYQDGYFNGANEERLRPTRTYDISLETQVYRGPVVLRPGQEWPADLFTPQPEPDLEAYLAREENNPPQGDRSRVPVLALALGPMVLGPMSPTASYGPLSAW